MVLVSELRPQPLSHRCKKHLISPDTCPFTGPASLCSTELYPIHSVTHLKAHFCWDCIFGCHRAKCTLHSMVGNAKYSFFHVVGSEKKKLYLTSCLFRSFEWLFSTKEVGFLDAWEVGEHWLEHAVLKIDTRGSKKPLQVPEKVLQLGNYITAQSRDHTPIKNLRGSETL